MWRWTKRILIGLAGLLIVALVAGTTYQWLATRRDMSATPPPGRLIDVGGHRLHLWCTGTGSPSVILETGLGGSTPDWGFVQPEVAKFTRVCSYDRAGMGYSDPGPSPRTAGRIASELALLLDRSEIGRPFVLVGASFGGFSVRLLASEHGEHVAGLVLVDASHENQAHETPSRVRFIPWLAPTGVLRWLDMSVGPSPESLAPTVRDLARATRYRAAGYRAAADELIHFPESAAEVRATRRALPMPVVVVTGARNPDDTWRKLQRDQMGISTRGCQMMAERSGHLVAIAQPEVVVDAIRAVVEAARGGNDGPVC